MIREWYGSIETQEDQLSSLPLWINLVLLRELWIIEGIGLSQFLCVPLGMDELTMRMEKKIFARVCVLVSILNFQIQSLLISKQESM